MARSFRCGAELPAVKIGHWEGDTLVVETTNVSSETSYRGSSENLRLIERFTRVADDLVLYHITVDDPTVWTQPWTQGVPLTILSNTENQIYEVCLPRRELFTDEHSCRCAPSRAGERAQVMLARRPARMLQSPV